MRIKFSYSTETFDVKVLHASTPWELNRTTRLKSQVIKTSNTILTRPDRNLYTSSVVSTETGREFPCNHYSTVLDLKNILVPSNKKRVSIFINMYIYRYVIVSCYQLALILSPDVIDAQTHHHPPHNHHRRKPIHLGHHKLMTVGTTLHLTESVKHSWKFF